MRATTARTTSVALVDLHSLLLVAALGVVCCDRDESKPQRGARLLSEVQLSRVAHDAKELASLASEELRTAAAVQQAVTQRKEEVAQEQQESSEADVEETDSTAADDGEQVYGEEGEESYNSLTDGDRDSLLAKDIHQETQEDTDLSSGSMDEQPTDGAMKRKLAPTYRHPTDGRAMHGKVSAQLLHGGGVLRRNPVRPMHERKKVQNRGTSMEELYAGELKEETDSAEHQGDTDVLGSIEDQTDAGPFETLKDKQRSLESAHAKLQEVATQATDLAVKTYQDINAYEQTVAKLNTPVHEVSEHVHNLHQKFEGSIRSGEEERLRAWQALDTQLQNAGVDDNS